MTSLFSSAAVAVAATAGLVCAPTAGADTALWVRGASVVEIPIVEVLARVPAGYRLQEVDYPGGLWPWTGLGSATGAHSVAVGVPALDQAIRAVQGQGRTLVIGESLGSLVVDQQLRDLAARPDAPDPSTARFEVIAAPGRPGGLLSYLPVGAYEPLTGTRIKPVPETPYDVTVIKLQYDAIASWPDRPWHLLSVLNAVAGGVLYHGTDHYGNAAQDVINGRVSPERISTTVNSQGGVTTTYTVQQNPAFLHPLEPIFPEAVAAVNKVLAPIINLGYSELTPDAGPHLAPGGQLIGKNGKPVFQLPAAQLPAAQLPTARPAVSAARAAASADTPPARRSPVTTSTPADRDSNERVSARGRSR
jgi:hypothetical protein